MLTIIQKAFAQFMEDDCMTLAAALAYYTLFAMPPLLFLLVTVVSWGMSTRFESQKAEERAKAFLELQAANLIGNRAAAEEIGMIIENTQHQSGTWWKSLLSLAAVLVASTGVMAALQASLNRVWRVTPVDERFAVQFLLKRLISLAMILGLGFLLLVSFVVSTALHFFSQRILESSDMAGLATFLVNQSVTFVMSWVLFLSILRFMPDAMVGWKEAIVGGLVTVVLFTLGRTALYYYLFASDPGAQLGSAAGSLVVILLWVYYSSICLLFGAELTVNLNPRPPIPEAGAARVDSAY